MTTGFTAAIRATALAALTPLVAAFSVPVLAQDMETVDPNVVIDGDLLDSQSDDQVTGDTATDDSSAYTGAYDLSEATPRYQTEDTTDPGQSTDARPVLDLPPMEGEGEQVATVDTEPFPPVDDPETVYGEDDLIGAAEGLFGRGAEGLARLIQDILADQGEPNGYIVGREGSGAFILGVRYGSGTLYHAVEGNMPVYWTGPSIGLDAGANAGNTFVLVYNLYDTEELYERFPAGEGQAYFVGGFTASYVRRGDIVLIPIRVGAGLRLGINAGYMRFSREQRWLPF
ncbi:DUF1134 domain-containing protein [Aurantiacibacter sediminis]|uniref:DUF1134 domain-containing protein n=1 Tax=Aurantiacibacter sediminis TaxID=2793064 RepID=A0ABS0N1G3_9SPHN|nr:DUF1134 domain-containing protein [Aurantiacibacter sediminis]MBH5321796.1 DUF1134 domain-containing protein [Aurantiacibacter sediminis]